MPPIGSFCPWRPENRIQLSMRIDPHEQLCGAQIGQYLMGVHYDFPYHSQYRQTEPGKQLIVAYINSHAAIS